MEKIFRGDIEVYFMYYGYGFSLYYDFEYLWYFVEGFLDVLWVYGILGLFGNYCFFLCIIVFLCNFYLVENFDVVILGIIDRIFV